MIQVLCPRGRERLIRMFWSFRALFRLADGGGERMGAFQRRDDAFVFAQKLERLDGLASR